MWIDKSAIEDVDLSFLTYEDDEAHNQHKDPQIIVEEIKVNDNEVLRWVRENCEPQEVFGVPALEMWAEDNGYIPDPDL